MNFEQQGEKGGTSRETVLEAFKRLKSRGIENPWDDQGTAKEAWDVYNSFSQDISKEYALKTDKTAPLKLNQEVSIDMIIRDAGYSLDEESIDSVLDFLEQDLQVAMEVGDQDLIEKIQSEIAVLEASRAQL